jgi:hypothetical protein
LIEGGVFSSVSKTSVFFFLQTGSIWTLQPFLYWGHRTNIYWRSSACPISQRTPCQPPWLNFIPSYRCFLSLSPPQTQLQLVLPPTCLTLGHLDSAKEHSWLVRDERTCVILYHPSVCKITHYESNACSW